MNGKESPYESQLTQQDFCKSVCMYIYTHIYTYLRKINKYHLSLISLLMYGMSVYVFMCCSQRCSNREQIIYKQYFINMGGGVLNKNFIFPNVQTFF